MRYVEFFLFQLTRNSGSEWRLACVGLAQHWFCGSFWIGGLLFLMQITDSHLILLLQPGFD
jgi:hypothetical protein